MEVHSFYSFQVLRHLSFKKNLMKYTKQKYLFQSKKGSILKLNDLKNYLISLAKQLTIY